MNHQVFICHASEDKPIADAVCAILEEGRVKCWIAPRDILPADDYGQAIVESIATSRLVVFVFSASANASPHVKRELECAVSHGIPILPFRIEDVIPSESLQYYLGGIHWLDALTPPLEEHLHHLAGTVRVLLDREEQATASTAPAPPLPPPPAPPGPAPLPPPPVAVTPATPPRGPRRAWMIGVAALVAIGIAVGIGVAVGGGGGGGSTTTTSFAAASSSDMLMAQRACSLLNADDVRSVFGSAADPGTPSSSDDWCDFGAFEAVTIEEEPASLADYTSSRELAAPGTVDIPDVGGGAYQDPNSGTLTVYDENRGVIFTMITGGSSAGDFQRLVDLAKLIVSRG